MSASPRKRTNCTRSRQVRFVARAIVARSKCDLFAPADDGLKLVFERGCEQFILGSGQMGNVHLSPEAEAYFAKKGCKVLLQPTSEAIDAFNGSHAKKIGLFHVTC